MTAMKKARNRSRRTVRIAATAATLGVVGCFTAAFANSATEGEGSAAPAETLVAAAR